MHERALLIIALIFSLVGLLFLFVLAAFSQPSQVRISELDDNIGKIVSVTAEVKDVNYKEDVVFLKLQDESGSVMAVFFGNPENKIGKDDFVMVKGKVQIYKGDLEIIIQELVCVKCS